MSLPLARARLGARLWVCALAATLAAACFDAGEAAPPVPLPPSVPTVPTVPPPPPPPPLPFPDACDPSMMPDEACYVAKRAPSSAEVALALELAHGYIGRHPPATLPWDWGEGVLMYAMAELGRVTADERVRAYYRDYIEHHLARGYELVWSDSCPPALAAIQLYVETGDPRYASVAEGVLRYLTELAPRTEEGGISHLGTYFASIRTLWVDSLFMFGMVLNRWAEVGGDARALELMGEQRAIFSARLQSPAGFFVHADRWPVPQDPDVYWARGNAWVMAGVADYLRVRTLRRERDDAAGAAFAAQVAAAVGAQDPATGGWHTVLNRPETYLETSAAGLFAYGMARAYRYGQLGEEALPPVRRALDAVRAAVVRGDPAGPVVTKVSGPTDVGTYASYSSVPLVDDISYGTGAAILALIESSGLP
ncbi:MAG TPA: glycoside hydrolase family 88 protein [Polyangiaceae bacterium]|nr:glycoside hydrolase family 88 protein [Polyangiaceae bacterium]